LPGSPLKVLLKTSLPAMVDLSSQTLMWMIEAMLVGHLGAAALAGVGMAAQVVIFTSTLLLTFVMGSSIIVSQYLGAGRVEEANHFLGQSVMMSGLASLGIAALWYFAAPLIFKTLLGAEPQAASQGIGYLRIIACFGPLIIVNFVSVGILRGAGDTHLSMMVSLAVNGINAVLTTLLIYGLFGFPRLEVKGAALATGIAHSIGFAITLTLLLSHRSVLSLRMRDLKRFNLRSSRQLFLMGAPITLEQMVWVTGQMFVMSYAARISTVALATHQVLLRLQAVISMLYQGIGMGAMTLTGKSLGANQEERARRVGTISSRIVFFTVVVVAAVLFFLARPIMYLFTSDPRVIHLGVLVLGLVAVIQVPKALNIVISGSLRGAGDIRWLMILTTVGVLAFEIFGAWALGFLWGLGLVGLWLATGIDESSRSMANYLRYRGSRWGKEQPTQV